MKSFKRFKGVYFVVLIAVAMMISGCASDSGGKGDGNGDGSGKEPITLKVQFGPDEHFNEVFIEPAEEEFSHITFEYVEGDLEELVASQNTPDILWFWDQGWMEHASELEMTYDMTELIEQSGFDIDRYDENQLGAWQIFSDDEIWALPISADRFALMYNKEIFDQFGVDYPEDGLTWEEVIEIGKKVSGEMNGVEYNGLYMPKAGGSFNWTIGNLIDPDTDEPLWPNNETLHEYFELYKETYSIQGNPYINEHWEEDGWPELFAQGRLAMAPHWFMPPPEDSGVNWDIATYPEPENGVPADGWAVGISSTSEHKEAVLEVFDFWLSDEQMLENTFVGGPLSLPFQHLYDDGRATDKVIETQGEVWEERNMDALFSLPVAEPLERVSKYDNDEAINDALLRYIEEDIDLNTLMRESYEEEVARVADLKEQE